MLLLLLASCIENSLGTPDPLPVDTDPPIEIPDTDVVVDTDGPVDTDVPEDTDVPDTDFIVRLCDVYPDGRSFNLCEGAVRARFRESVSKESLLTPGKIYPIEVDLWSTSVIFNTAHRIRLQVTSSSAPGYDPNPNTGAEFRSNKETRKATVRLFLNEDHPSHVLLPVVTQTQP